jgi:hypothetical protein
MFRPSTLALLLASAATAQPPSCRVSTPAVCYFDAPVRAVAFLAVGGSKTLDVAACADACASNGFVVAALTSNPAEAYCYCGAAVAAGAARAPAVRCDRACPGDARDNCGGVNVSAVYALSCAGPLPPSPVGPPLAFGRACSQPEVKSLPFCDAALPRKDRVADLVARMTLPELASQLQARSSAAVPRLGLPPFYWGSNQLHGISGAHCSETGRCPVSWPDGVALTSSFNETAWQLQGAVAGREMRALYNVAYANSSNVRLATSPRSAKGAATHLFFPSPLPTPPRSRALGSRRGVPR